MPIGWAIVIIALWLAVIALTVVVLGVLRQVMPYLERAGAQSAMPMPMPAQGPAVGSRLPGFAARDNHGDVVNAAQLRGKPSVLLFLSSGCSPCIALAEELGHADQGELAGSL